MCIAFPCPACEICCTVGGVREYSLNGAFTCRMSPSRSAADAPFGGAVTYQNQSSITYHTLAVELVSRAKRWLLYESVWEEALSPQLVEEEASRDLRSLRREIFVRSIAPRLSGDL